MNYIDRVSWLDMTIQMQLSTIEQGYSRVVCSKELVEWGSIVSTQEP